MLCCIKETLIHNFVFSSELLLSTIQSTDHVAASDALVYCVGALKFLSGNATVLKQLVHLNCLEAVAKLLVAINKTVWEVCHMNIQIVARFCKI